MDIPSVFDIFNMYSYMLGNINNILNIFSIIFFLLSSWGIYMINKKLGEKYAWISWFPVLQYYSIVKASGKSLWWILWIILIGLIPIILIIVLILGLITSGLMEQLINWFLFSGFLNNWIMFIIVFLLIFLFIILIASIGYIIILHSISKRCNRGGWTTLGLYLIPYIIFPVIGYKLAPINKKINESIKNDIQDAISDNIKGKNEL